MAWRLEAGVGSSQHPSPRVPLFNGSLREWHRSTAATLLPGSVPSTLLGGHSFVPDPTGSLTKFLWQCVIFTTWATHPAYPPPILVLDHHHLEIGSLAAPYINTPCIILLGIMPTFWIQVQQRSHIEGKDIGYTRATMSGEEQPSAELPYYGAYNHHRARVDPYFIKRNIGSWPIFEDVPGVDLNVVEFHQCDLHMPDDQRQDQWQDSKRESKPWGM